MTREYPRHYLVVESGKVEKVTAKDSVHELAIILKHPEATGMNRPEPYDNSKDVIKDKDQERNFYYAQDQKAGNPTKARPNSEGY